MKNFLNIAHKKKLYKGKYFFIIKDSFPVSPGHLLIISNDLIEDYFNLPREAKKELYKVIDLAKEIIEGQFNPDGFNIGMNCGVSAGQTIFHFHCHVIPRYNGDIDNPEGGVRGVIPDKMRYK